MPEVNEYEEYEKECKVIRERNACLLEIFENDMSDLTEKTRKRHLENVEFYINEFLLRCDALPMEEGISMIGEYLGDFFIRKCMWSTPGTIKSTAASIKKFYKCMLDHDEISKEDYQYLCSVIGSDMDIWQADCEQFNDPDAENPFAFF